VLIDTHAHLNDKAFDADRADIIRSAGALGVRNILDIACAPEEWPRSEALSAAHPGIRSAYGVHPEYIKDFSAAALPALEAFLSRPAAIGVGEIGLDYWWEAGNRAGQLELLETQLPLCARHSKPAIFHARNGKEAGQDAYADLAASLRNWGYSPKARFRGVLHCFAGSWEDARAALDLGLALGVNGTFTYKKNDDLRQNIKKAGTANIVLETDCPYLPPQSSRGERNAPTFIPEIAAMAASYLGLSNAQIADATTANALDLFGRF